jgi:hypothetical protein
VNKQPKTFGLVGPYDMLRKLERELELCQPSADRDATVFAAVNFAVTAWHLPEWMAKTVATMSQARQAEISTALDGTDTADFVRLRDWALAQCPGMEYCRQIASWTKHLECSRERGVVMDTDVSARATGTLIGLEGAVHTEADEGTVWVPKIVDGDQRIPVHEAFDHVCQFWLDVFHKRAPGDWDFEAKTLKERNPDA